MAETNGWSFFGWELSKKKKQEEDNNNRKTFAQPSNEDGALVIQTGSYYGTYVDLDGTSRNEIEQITKYREVANQAEIETAIDDIVNEAIVRDDTGKSVNIRADNFEKGESVKKKIQEEFNNVLRLLAFGNNGHDIFRKWYIDGRLYYHIIIDEANRSKGIQELRYIDPRRIRKVKEVIKERLPENKGVETIKTVNEYFLYNDRGLIGALTNLGVKIRPDSIVYVPSGLLDPKRNTVISYLQKAIKPLNQLRMVEDALVIYRLSRAPERRVFYVDVGTMSAKNAQAYLEMVATKYRNKLVYDATTGEIRDDRRHLSMLEDFWLPRREGGKGTEIDTLPGGENLGKIEDVDYFLKKLYKALSVPIGRADTSTGGQQGLNLGRAAEITRDELKFFKFVDRLRVKFSGLFDQALRVQLVLKGIIREEEWDDIREQIYYDYLTDNDYREIMEAETMRERFALLSVVDVFTGKYFSVEWVRKNVLKLAEEEIKEIDEQIDKEKDIPQFTNPNLPMNNPEMNGDQLPGGKAGPPVDYDPVEAQNLVNQEQQKRQSRFTSPFEKG
jgi:hypothetical protein